MIAIEATVSTWGNSHGIRIPKELLEKLGVREKDKVSLSLENDALMIKATKKKQRNLKQIVEDYYQTDFETALIENPYTFECVDFGKPEGGEVW